MENNELTQYMNGAVERLFGNVMKSTVSNPRESAFLMKAVRNMKKAQKIRSDFEKKGIHIPAFLISSITTSCNLNCKGCYARANHICGEGTGQEMLTDERWGALFDEAARIGVSFILLAGGEPLLRRELIEKASKTGNIIFPVFTNGTVIDDSYIRLFDKSRNLVPVVSVEGSRKATDERRGDGVYDEISVIMKKLKKAKILFGTSITLTTRNCGEISSDEFIGELYKSGCRIVFFIEYVPVNNTVELAPTQTERSFMEQRQKELRAAFPDMIFLSFPGDEKFTGGCLAAGRGFFHINPYGSAEPCPFSPFSDISLKTCGITEALQSPLFQKLSELELVGGEHDGGCALFSREEDIRRLINK